MVEFAVIIPTYQRPELLVQAVDSVLGQTYAPSEVLVVRDGPHALVPETLPSSPALRVLDRPKQGVAAARNAGIAASASPWICFLDDDDLWHPHRLERTAEYLDTHPECAALQAASWTFAAAPARGVDIVASDLASCMEATGLVRPVTDMSYLDITGRSFDLLLERNRGSISTSTVKREVMLDARGFPEGYTCAEDWVMFINVARFVEWHYLDERLSFIRKHERNNTVVNPTNDLVTIRAIRAVWADRSLPEPAHRPLGAYGVDYRFFAQRAFWRAVRRRLPRIAAAIAREAFALLPRWRDRLVVILPPAVEQAARPMRRTVQSRTFSAPCT